MTDTQAHNAPNFYLAGSEREMMRRISDILRKQGYVGIADPSGRTHFLLEPDSNPYRVLKKIRDVQEHHPSRDRASTLERSEQIRSLLRREGFNLRTCGTDALHEILLYLSSSEVNKRTSNKSLYVAIGSRTGRTPQQIERNIRYAVSQSNMHGSNTDVILELFTKLWTEEGEMEASELH